MAIALRLFCQFGFDDLSVGFAGARRGAAAWLPRLLFGLRVDGHLYGRMAGFAVLRPHPPGGRTAISAARRYALAVSRRICAALSMRRNDHPSRPSAMTCCFFPSLKTLLTLTDRNLSSSLNVLIQ